MCLTFSHILLHHAVDGKQSFLRHGLLWNYVTFKTMTLVIHPRQLFPEIHMFRIVPIVLISIATLTAKP